MRGKIVNFKAEKGFGFILGEDNQQYFFHISSVSNKDDVQVNYSVEFEPKENNKGLNAVNITINTPLAYGSKDKILKIKNLRIRASIIKEYELTREEHDGYEQDEDGCYKYKLKNNDWKFRFKEDVNKNIDDIMIDNCSNIECAFMTQDKWEDWSVSPFDCQDYKRNCYYIKLLTYDNEQKKIKFISHDEIKNKKEANYWLDYIDEELNKLI